MKYYLLIALGLWGASNSWACNQIKKVGGNNENITNNPNTLLTLELKRNQVSTTCEYVIGVTKGSSQDGSYNRFLQRNQIPIPIKFWDENSSKLIFDYPDATPPSNLIVGYFTNSTEGKTRNELLRVDLGPVPYNIPAGRYFNNFHVRMWTRPLGSTANFTLANDDNFEIRYDLSKALDISLVSSGAPFNLVDTSESVNFGSMSQNQTRTFDMIIGNNTAYSYSMNSINNGRLLRAGGNPASSNDRVAYELKIASTAYSSQVILNAGNFPYASSVINPPSGTQLRFPIEVKIVDNPSAKNQGQYNDTITIDVIAN